MISTPYAVRLFKISFSALAIVTSACAQEIWRLANAQELSGKSVTVLGAPKSVPVEQGGAAVNFDGKADGLVVPAIPLVGATAFTIEVLFWPEEGGSPEQRFIHLEDKAGSRALLETRLDGKGGWWLDTFLFKAGGRGLALIDPKRVYPTNKWYWAALRYDGKKMTQYLNGVKELEGDVEFTPFGEGQTSMGVRLNKVFWFKGKIRELRFHREAVSESTLQKQVPGP